MLDALGHLFYVWLVAGQWLLTHKHRSGWLVRAGGSLGWLVVGWLLGLTSIVVWSAVFIGVDIRGWWKWMQQDDSSGD